MKKFDKAVEEKLGHYVYYLKDPRPSGKGVFYIGKGGGKDKKKAAGNSRMFQHVLSASETNKQTETLNIIREIEKSGKEVKHFILRHGLKNEAIAIEIEAALIDFIGVKNLSNLQSGHRSDDYGLKRADEIAAMYKVEQLSTNEPLLLININKLYDRRLNDEDLYNATRKAWVLDRNRLKKVKYAVATYHGLTREVYKIDDWYPCDIDGKTRWGFNGDKANSEIRQKLSYKSLDKYRSRGNPIRYVNC